MQDLSKLRREYDQDPLDVESFEDCPFNQFEQWFMLAANRLREPNAMVIATTDSKGAPTQRSVLLKYYDKSGFVFFTNYESRKADHISGNQQVSLLFSMVRLPMATRSKWDSSKNFICRINKILRVTSSWQSIGGLGVVPKRGCFKPWIAAKSFE